MGYIRYRKGVSDHRHLRRILTAADGASTSRRVDWFRLRSTASDILPFLVPRCDRSTSSTCSRPTSKPPGSDASPAARQSVKSLKYFAQHSERRMLDRNGSSSAKDGDSHAEQRRNPSRTRRIDHSPRTQTSTPLPTTTLVAGHATARGRRTGGTRGARSIF